ncbi:selenocysteine lyase [Thioclava dalianensis]|uniref:Probable septum site-determining protein MinC n=1 Tax=Thioclava dalianensis TaxID=1185766 RepID=A0A074U0T9_9RHOB|nr:septum site-determining protein MinC [Thioclava dalianensis]KEP68257.1 selenocysteine lyase [Thioclava dalianensis]SFM90076.1 septum site-determining protein MinC [Thioclava dalianensis]
MQTPSSEDRSASDPVSVRPFHFRGLFLTAVALRIETTVFDESFYTRLDAQLAQAPQILDDAPIVLDFALVPELDQPGTIRDLIDNLFQRDLLIFGAQNATELQLSTVRGYGIIPIKVGRETALPAARAKAKRAEAKAAAPAPASTNVTVTSSVRSGQMVVAEHGDLTIVGSVASGAEIVAAGSIHVYGTLRGRAIAGAHGDESARIYCRSQQAELMAIAGLYKTSETIPPELRKQGVQVFLDGDKLCVEAFE